MIIRHDYRCRRGLDGRLESSRILICSRIESWILIGFRIESRIWIGSKSRIWRRRWSVTPVYIEGVDGANIILVVD